MFVTSIVNQMVKQRKRKTGLISVVIVVGQEEKGIEKIWLIVEIRSSPSFYVEQQ